MKADAEVSSEGAVETRLQGSHLRETSDHATATHASLSGETTRDHAFGEFGPDRVDSADRSPVVADFS